MILPKSLAAVARTSSVASSAVRRVALATPRLAPRARVASPRQQDRQPARARLETQVFRTRAAALYARRHAPRDAARRAFDASPPFLDDVTFDLANFSYEAIERLVLAATTVDR